MNADGPGEAAVSDLRYDDDLLREACEEIERTLPEWAATWRHQISALLARVQEAGADTRESTAFHELLWEGNPISSLGAGGRIPVQEVIGRADFRRHLAAASMERLPESPRERDATLLDIYRYCVKAFEGQRTPKIKIFRVLAALFPDDFTSVASVDELGNVAALLLPEVPPTSVERHTAIMGRLRRVLGDTEATAAARAARMTLPWLLYERFSDDPKSSSAEGETEGEEAISAVEPKHTDLRNELHANLFRVVVRASNLVPDPITAPKGEAPPVVGLWELLRVLSHSLEEAHLLFEWLAGRPIRWGAWESVDDQDLTDNNDTLVSFGEPVSTALLAAQKLIDALNIRPERALFAVLVVAPGFERQSLFEMIPSGWGVTRERCDAVLDGFIAGIVRSATDPQTKAEWKRVLGHQQEVHTPERAEYTTDTPSADHDALDFETQARHFATLIAGKKTPLPLALGLFGEWGSGKSHFMELLEAQLKKICAPGVEGPYVRRAAIIPFNAWHYMDANLWASMALRIFDGLADEMTKSTAPAARRQEYEKQRLDAVKLLESQKAERARLEQQLEQMVTERASAASDIHGGEHERRKTEAALLHLLSEKNITEAQKLVNALDIWVGWSNTGEADELREKGAEALEKAVALRAQVEQAGGLLRTVLSQRWTTWLVPIGVMVVLTLAARFGWLSKGLAGVTEMLAGFIATAAGLSAWFGRQYASLQRVLDLPRRLRELAAVHAEGDEQTKGLEKNLRELDGKIAKHEAILRATDTKIEELSNKLEWIDRGGLVYEFLRQRSDAAEYRGQLGLISTIRDDFEKLDGVLQAWNTSGKYPIERIVLFIDDLDRCPANRVVEVLQAVHLLLAFKLFVVVVAVDPRWLARSLYELYMPELFREGANTSGLGSFDPHNYLEKIFQIPYTIPKMGEAGYRKLVAKTLDMDEVPPLLNRTFRSIDPLLAATTPTEPEEAGESDVLDPARSGEQPVVPDPEPAAVSPEERTEQPASSAARRLAEQPSPVPKDEALAAASLERWEHEYLSALGEFIKTPRLTKRLINIYRLLRLRAAGDSRGFASFISRFDGDFMVVLVLLAIAIDGDKRLRAIAGSLAQPTEATTFLELVRLLDYGEELVDKLVRLSETVGLVSDLEPYRHWAPRVLQFTFETIELAEIRNYSSRS